MKHGLIALALFALAGCATTAKDPYAANHAAPTESQRKPSSDDSCDSVTPRCQLGDSYAGGRTRLDGDCRETYYECEQTRVQCKDINGRDDTVDTLDYGTHSRDCN